MITKPPRNCVKTNFGDLVFVKFLVIVAVAVLAVAVVVAVVVIVAVAVLC